MSAAVRLPTDSGRLALVPLELGEANAFVVQHHRHHGAVRGHKFSLGAALGNSIIGVAIVGRPVSRERQDGLTLEITRHCTDNIKYPTGRINRKDEPTFHNAASFLYGAACKAIFALGYRRVGTYTLKSEGGKSLVAAGFRHRRGSERAQLELSFSPARGQAPASRQISMGTRGRMNDSPISDSGESG